MTDQTHGQAFDVKVVAGADMDGGKIGVLWVQMNAREVFFEPFDGDFFTKSGHDNLAVSCV